MKKLLILLLLIVTLLFTFSCKERSKYDDQISQLRNDVLKYECQEYTLTAYAEIIETPLSNDGVKGKTEKTLIFKLKNNNPSCNFENCSLSFSINGKSYAKNFDFKQIPTLLNCSVKVDNLPKTLDVMLTINGKSQTITLKSVKNKSTKSYGEVLKKLKKEESFSNKLKNAELRIRLINNDGHDYWYVGLVTKEKTSSYLLDGETLEIIARKED